MSDASAYETAPAHEPTYRVPGDRPPVPDRVPAASPATVSDEPEPLGVTVEATGNAEVDAVVERLGDVDALPVREHLDVYEDVHRGLRDALAALDENRG